MHIVLWADADRLPPAVEVNGGRVLGQRMHVAMDMPIDAACVQYRSPGGLRPDIGRQRPGPL